jgi:hypothetical protein
MKLLLVFVSCARPAWPIRGRASASAPMARTTRRRIARASMVDLPWLESLVVVLPEASAPSLVG